MEVSHCSFPLCSYTLLIEVSRLVQEIKEGPKPCTFRKLSTVAEALIFLLYKGDYNAINDAGISILPPRGSQSPSKRCTSLRHIIHCVSIPIGVLQGQDNPVM